MLDAMLDSKNIPSDDSSNSKSIAKDTPIIQTDEIVRISGESEADIAIENHPITEKDYTTQPKSFSFKAFYIEI
jgi:hypothetical protein